MIIIQTSLNFGQADLKDLTDIFSFSEAILPTGEVPIFSYGSQKEGASGSSEDLYSSGIPWE